MDHSPGFLALVNDAKSRTKEISPEATAARITNGDDLVLVDVREDHEWAAGHASGAVHLGRGILERDVEKAIPDPGKTLVLYCGGGFRSALAADNLQKMGYTDVWSMAGGYKAWVKAGLPVRQG